VKISELLLELTKKIDTISIAATKLKEDTAEIRESQGKLQRDVSLLNESQGKLQRDVSLLNESQGKLQRDVSLLDDINSINKDISSSRRGTQKNEQNRQAIVVSHSVSGAKMRWIS
jgi:chromosome segregation ATPase